MSLVKREGADKSPLAFVEWCTIAASVTVAMVLLGWTIYSP